MHLQLDIKEKEEMHMGCGRRGFGGFFGGSTIIWIIVILVVINCFDDC
ncbi:hypothetical protein [Brevibacillus daliensis]|nr:hypothetical protein [Brevibacillus daliensis]